MLSSCSARLRLWLSWAPFPSKNVLTDLSWVRVVGSSSSKDFKMPCVMTTRFMQCSMTLAVSPTEHQSEGNYLAIRPSGTEPKVKFYLFAYHPAEDGIDLAAIKAKLCDRMDALEHDLNRLANG